MTPQKIMARQILIIPDKFKGTLNAMQVADVIRQAWLSVHAEDCITCIPMSDGGDGFSEIMGAAIHAKTFSVETVDAAGRPRQARIEYSETTATAVIETAESNGLALLPTGKYHPFTLDTRGLGSMWKKAMELGATDILAGIGGSATNDGGFGLATRLGWVFLDANNEPILKWPDLTGLTDIIPPKDLDLPKCRVAVDVRNPLLGPEGATRVYGPQKGLQHTDFDEAEKALERLADVVSRQLNRDLTSIPGTGAAGGLGFGLMAFCSAQLVPGFSVFADAVQLEEKLKQTDLVITAEGAMDRQTVMGKCVGELALRCRNLNVPCLAFTGHLEDKELLEKANLFEGIHGISPDLTTKEASCAQPEYWLAKRVRMVAQRC